MIDKKTPLQDQQGHVWKEPDKGQTLCVNCGAYRHLGSGIMRCEKPATDRWKLETLLRDTGSAINANNGRCGLIEDVLCRMTSVLVARINELDAAEKKAKKQALSDAGDRRDWNECERIENAHGHDEHGVIDGQVFPE